MSLLHNIDPSHGSVDYQLCPLCETAVPCENLDLHLIRCERSSHANAALGASKPALKAKSKPKVKAVKKNPSKEADDLDSLLAEISLSDSTCKYADCKKSVSLVGTKCTFCSDRFCMSHSIPEVHGCAAAAKKHATHQLSKELRHGTRPRRLDADKKTQLQKKLDRKIKDLSTPRKKSSAPKWTFMRLSMCCHSHEYDSLPPSIGGFKSPGLWRFPGRSIYHLFL